MDAYSLPPSFYLKMAKRHCSLIPANQPGHVCRAASLPRALDFAAAGQARAESQSLSFDHSGGLWVFLVCGSPLKGLFVVETCRYKSFSNFSLLLSTTKHVQFSSNNKTLIHLCPYFLFSTAQVFSVLRLNLSGPSSCLPADVFFAETESLFSPSACCPCLASV